MSKFKQLEFPLVGFRKKPTKVSIERDRVLLWQNSKWLVGDDLTIPGSLIERVGKLKEYHGENAALWSYTCLELSHVIVSKITWGMHNKGIFDISNLERFKARNFIITQVKDTYYRVDKISYPFKLPSWLKTEELLGLYVQMVYIDEEWIPYRFSGERFLDNELLL